MGRKKNIGETMSWKPKESFYYFNTYFSRLAFWTLLPHLRKYWVTYHEVFNHFFYLKYFSSEYFSKILILEQFYIYKIIGKMVQKRFPVYPTLSFSI